MLICKVCTHSLERNFQKEVERSQRIPNCDEGESQKEAEVSYKKQSLDQSTPSKLSEFFLELSTYGEKNGKGKETVLRGAKYLVPRGRNAGREIFREGKHFGLWGKVEWRRKINWKQKMSHHQTSIKFHQNLQIQRPGIPVDR